jgi:shikimate kinase
VIVIVGPSRGGKTTLLKGVLDDFPNLALVDLDAEEIRAVASILASGGDPDGWEARWQRNREALARAEARHGTNNIIVDVGAGSLQTREGRAFFLGHGSSAIAVIAPFEVVLARHRGRDPQEFRQTEYSPEREAVYCAARYRIDSSQPVEASLGDLRVALSKLLSEHASVSGLGDRGSKS